MQRLVRAPSGAAPGAVLLPALLTIALAGPAPVRAQTEQDQLDLTGRQNLTLGAGARAFGMGGAFLARPDDGTAASWNPAGLSYLRLPEISLAGAHNSFQTQRGEEQDHFRGGTLDFASFTWPLSIGPLPGAVQLSYQRAISFDGTREIVFDPVNHNRGQSNGGFDVLAFGTGFRFGRRLRAGFTVNRWLNGYDQTLTATVDRPPRPTRNFELDMSMRGWSFNVGAIWSPVESLNVAAVVKTPFTASLVLAKRRVDYWGQPSKITEITENSYRSDEVRLDFPSSFGFGLSWRPHDTLTLSADFTQTDWSQATIHEYFELRPTPTGGDPESPATPPPPVVFSELPYPTLTADQVDSQQMRVGVEYVVIRGRLKVPLRAGYLNDRQVTPNLDGGAPRFNGVTVGTGLILGSLLLDVAYLYEFGSYEISTETTPNAMLDVAAVPPTIRTSISTRRFFASLIYRFPIGAR